MLLAAERNEAEMGASILVIHSGRLSGKLSMQYFFYRSSDVGMKNSFSPALVMVGECLIAL